MSTYSKIDVAPAGFTGILGTASATSNATPRLRHATADALWVKTTGTSPDIKVEYEYSQDNSAWSSADDESDLSSSTATDFSNNTAGWNAINLGLVSAPYYRFKVTELGNNTVTVEMKLQIVEDD